MDGADEQHAQAAVTTPSGPDDPYAWDRGARLLEARGACRGIVLLALAIVMLAGLGLLRGRTNVLTDRAEDPRLWASSLLILGLVLISLQFVLLLLAYEHATAELDPSRLSGVCALGGAWAFRIVIVLLVVAAIYWSAPREHWGPIYQIGTVRWDQAGWLLAGSQLVVGVLVAYRAWRIGRIPEVRVVQADRRLRAADQPFRTSAGGGETLLAISASGGGLRAASFVLGGHQAAQQAAPELGMDPSDEPDVFAVSGGSYLAGALALRRRFDETSRQRDEADPWRETYRRDSPEVRRLRRNTNYLFQPASRLRDGVVTLLVGIVVNLLLVGVALRFLVWVSAQLSVALQLVVVSPQLSDTGLVHQGAVKAISYRLADNPWHVLLVPTAAGLGVLFLTVVQWFAASSFDHECVEEGEPRPRAARLLAGAALLRPAVVLLGLGWLLLTWVLPGATVGVAAMATANQPTARVASWLTTSGLVDADVCRTAFAAHIDEAVQQANTLAVLDPGTEQSVTADACGARLTIHRTYLAATATAAATTDAEPVSGDSPVALTTPEKQVLRAYLDRNPAGAGGQVASVAGLLALVGGLLRRVTSPVASAPQGRLAPLRKKLMTWLPLSLFGLLAVYLSLLWSRGLISRVGATGSPHFLQVTVVVTVVGCVIAFLLDANVTSMHRYYRSSLASAFAVGASATTAEPLRADRVYSFSSLGTDARSPRLNVVTTLNTQAPDETPSGRGGLPVVFTPDAVRVFDDPDQPVAIPMSTYERFAGPGRVSVMATIGISGAAVSPLMGRFDEQVAPFRFLLALFNLRLGVWTRNPLHTPDLAPELVGVGGRRMKRAGPGFLWITEKPGLVQMILEAVGSSSAKRRWVYLSDGGHLDNTGLVEAVRRFRDTSGRLLVLDASNDSVDSWSAVGDAVAVVRADLGLDLQHERWKTDAGPEWARRYVTRAGARLEVLVVKAVRVTPPEGDEQNPWWDVLSPDIHSFSRDHHDFPRASTARQKFGDLEFEAYRQLGFIATTTAFTAAGWM